MAFDRRILRSLKGWRIPADDTALRKRAHSVACLTCGLSGSDIQTQVFNRSAAVSSLLIMIGEQKSDFGDGSVKMRDSRNSVQRDAR